MRLGQGFKRKMAQTEGNTEETSATMDAKRVKAAFTSG